MNNVFDIKRFGRYFLYDLNNARGNYAFSALVIGLLPLILLVFNVIFGLVFTGTVPTIPVPVKVTILVCAFLICILTAPAKLYGRLTERRAGSDWLMIPASPFEKFLSMAIILCVVLPILIFGLFTVCDLLLSWMVPAYGDSLTSAISSGFWSLDEFSTVVVSGISESFGTVTKAGLIGSICASWCSSILTFGLGALCFKKGKAAKTILCLIGVEILLSIFLVLFLRGGYDSGFELGLRLKRFLGDISPEKVQSLTNLLINCTYIVIIGGLVTAIFFRIKTIKH